MQKFVFALLAAVPLLATQSATAVPIEYVRVCSAFGVGYFYIPGTERCLNPDTGVIKYQNADGTVTTLSTQQQDIVDTQAAAANAQDTADGAQAAADKAQAAADKAQRRADLAVDGVAMSLAMQPAMVTEGHTYGMAFNIGTFGGSTALAVSGAYALNDNVTFNGSVGAALGSGEVAGHGGVNISW